MFLGWIIGGITLDARAALDAIIEYTAKKAYLSDVINHMAPERVDELLNPIAEKFSKAMSSE